MATVPLAPWVTALMLRVSPASGAIESLASTAIAFAPESSLTVAASLLATGASLTLLTVTVTVAVALPPLPSAMV